MRHPYLLRLLLLLTCSAFSILTATAQVSTAKICLSAAKARQIADSLAALPDCRQEAKKWQHIADSTQAKASLYQAAAAYNLDAKRAAENSEQFQARLTTNERAQKEEFKSKAQRRGFLVWALVVVDALVIALLVAQ